GTWQRWNPSQSTEPLSSSLRFAAANSYTPPQKQPHGRSPMHEYDVALKLTLQQVDVAIRELTGTVVARWLSLELPEIRNTRVDLLGETESGDLVHIELQSSNDRTMALRMAEYALRVFRLFGKFPYQVLLYVGDAPLNMEAGLSAPGLQYSYR